MGHLCAPSQLVEKACWYISGEKKTQKTLSDKRQRGGEKRERESETERSDMKKLYYFYVYECFAGANYIYMMGKARRGRQVP